MRGADTYTESLFLMKRLDDFVPTGHPLRSFREMVNKSLVAMNDVFADMVEANIKVDRSTVAPEKMLRTMLLQVLYSVRSERTLMLVFRSNETADLGIVTGHSGHRDRYAELDIGTVLLM